MTDSPAPPQHHEGHHRSARERQRKGPMWGCLRAIAIGIIVTLALLFLVIGSGYWYLGSSSFAGLVKLRIENTLENRLGRDVSIGQIEVVRARPQKIIIRDLRIANSPGAVSPYFATVKEVVLTGGVESLWGRRVKISRIDVTEPHLWFEIYPAGSPLVHNFPHWRSSTSARCTSRTARSTSSIANTPSPPTPADWRRRSRSRSPKTSTPEHSTVRR
jgi:hypothetical protein